jgi:hypothetical protein
LIYVSPIIFVLCVDAFGLLDTVTLLDAVTFPDAAGAAGATTPVEAPLVTVKILIRSCSLEILLSLNWDGRGAASAAEERRLAAAMTLVEKCIFKMTSVI